MSKFLSTKNTSFQSNISENEESLKYRQNYLLNKNEFNSKPLIKDKNSLLFNNNLLYSKHYSPSTSRIKSSLSPTLPILKPNNSNSRIISSSKKNKIIKLFNSNSLGDIYSQNNIISPQLNNKLIKEKSQADLPHNINIIKDKQNNKKVFNNIFYRNEFLRNDKTNNIKNNRNRYGVKQINNIKNINHINIHIYSSRINTENEIDKNTNIAAIKTDNNNSSIYNKDDNYKNIIKKDNNINKNLINKKKYNMSLNNINNGKNFALTPKKEFLKKYNEYLNTEDKIIKKQSNYKNYNQIQNLKSVESQNLNKNDSKEKTVSKNKSSNLKDYSSLQIITNEFNTNDNNENINNNYKSSTFKFTGNLILKKNYNKGTKKIINKRYKLLDRFDFNNINDNKEDTNNFNNLSNIKEDINDSKKLNTEGNINIINYKKEELNNINEAKYFLNEINEDNKNVLIIFIKLIQIHLDIEILLDNSSTNNFRRRITTYTNDKIYKLNNLINNYFNTLSHLQNITQIQENNINIESKNNKQDEINNSNSFLYQRYNIFIFNIINNLFHKCIKLQICYYAAFLVSLSQLNIDNIDTMIRTNFEKIIKEISNPLYTLFKIFIMNEIKEKYIKLLSNNIKQNFYEKFNKYFNEDKMIYCYKKSDILKLISNNINKCIDSLKAYSNYNLKNSVIKCFGDAFNQMLFKLERKTLNKFIDIFLYTLLFGELEINKQKTQKNLEELIKNNVRTKNNSQKKLYYGSSIKNNINNNPPFLPEINPKYKYTLVLDMDETLVHFFFTTMNGMFFVRPYCFDFLKELNKYYEIVTFTAGIKDYADNILNLLDTNDNIIKYRLYRQHVTISGFNSYKNLKLLGRDLKKIIIIDNLKENFMMQPDNGLYIKTWTSDVNDTQFIDLLNILKNIAINNVDDVRPIIQRINEKINDNGDLINPYSKINIKKIIDDERK